MCLLQISRKNGVSSTGCDFIGALRGIQIYPDKKDIFSG